MVSGSGDQRQGLGRSEHALAQRVRFPGKPAKSASRHCQSGRLVLGPGTATTATRGCSRPPGHWLTGRHCCGAGTVGYRPTRGRSVAGWPFPATSVAAAGGSRPERRRWAALGRPDGANSVRCPLPVCRQWCSVPWFHCCGDFWFAQAVAHLGSFCGGFRDGGGGVGADGRLGGAARRRLRPGGQAGRPGGGSGPGRHRCGAAARRQAVGTAARFWRGTFGGGSSGGLGGDGEASAGGVADRV